MQHIAGERYMKEKRGNIYTCRYLNLLYLFFADLNFLNRTGRQLLNKVEAHFEQGAESISEIFEGEKGNPGDFGG